MGGLTKKTDGGGGGRGGGGGGLGGGEGSQNRFKENTVNTSDAVFRHPWTFISRKEHNVQHRSDERLVTFYLEYL